MKILEDVISSRQNPMVKLAFSLQDKKGRQKEGAFLAEGEKLTLEAARSKLPVRYVFIDQRRAKALVAQMKEAFCDPMYDCTVLAVLSSEAFEKISTEKSPQGVISVIKSLDFFKELDIIYNVENYFSFNERVLALCSVRDPSNLGAILRSALAFGVEHIVLSDDCVDPYNPKTVRAAMGALFKIKLTIVHDFARLVSDMRCAGRNVYAAELRENAISLYDLTIKGRDVVVIGNEGHGIPNEISALCTASVYIPISSLTESLNASVAAGIFMWEQGKE